MDLHFRLDRDESASTWEKIDRNGEFREMWDETSPLIDQSTSIAITGSRLTELFWEKRKICTKVYGKGILKIGLVADFLSFITYVAREEKKRKTEAICLYDLTRGYLIDGTNDTVHE